MYLAKQGKIRILSKLEVESNRELTKKRKKKEFLTILLFLIVPIALLVMFTFVPFVNMVRYSLTDWDGLRNTSNFVGVDNYVQLFTRPEYKAVFKNTLYYLIGAIIQIVLALFLAYLVGSKYKGADFYKGIIFFPSLLNGVAIGLIFLFFFKEGGTLDSILTAFGMNADNLPRWIGDANIVNISLVFAMLWRYIGQNVVIFSGAILSTDKSALEAASLDGATEWQKFRYIVLPGLKPVIGVGLILAIKSAISVFELPYIITGGKNGSSTFVVQTINTAFQSRKVGMASAMGIVLLIVIMVITIFQNKFSSEEEE